MSERKTDVLDGEDSPGAQSRLGPKLTLEDTNLEKVVCPSCASHVVKSKSICPACGHSLGNATSATPVAPQTKAGRRIRETKSTCLSCGKVWHYGKADVLESTGAAMQNLGKSMMCCTGYVPQRL